MRYPSRAGSRERTTLCISSQAGCAVGCPFCATGELGFGAGPDDGRDRRPGPLRRATARLGGRRLTNIVYMGMGEPLLNLDRVLASVGALSDPRRFGLGARHITVSTSGVVPGIRRLTALGPQFTLAVCLHAARDPLRDVLVPLNRRWPVAEVLDAARDHAASHRPAGELRVHDDRRRQRHGRRRAGARGAAAGRPRACQPDPDEPGRAHALDGQPDAGDRGASPRGSRRPGSRSTVRRNRGLEIGAACGQLAAEHAGEPPARGRGASPRAARDGERRPPCAASAAREPVPAGPAGRGGPGLMAGGRARVSASILDADLGNLANADPAGREGRARTASTSTSWMRTCPQPHVRGEDDQGPPAADPSCRSTPT